MPISIIRFQVYLLFSYLFKRDLLDVQNHSFTKPSHYSSTKDKKFSCKRMATKVFSCLLVVFVLLAVFSSESDAFGNGAMPGGKRLFQRKKGLPVSKRHFQYKVYLTISLMIWPSYGGIM